MESGRWVDGRYQPFGFSSPGVPDGTAALLDAAPPETPSLPAGDGDGAVPPAGTELAAGDDDQGSVAVSGAGFDGVLPRSSDATLRLMAVVLTPVAVLLVAAGVTVLVRDDPASVAAAGGAPSASRTSDDGPAPLPPLPDFGPADLPALPPPPVVDDAPAADVPVQAGRPARQAAPTTARAPAVPRVAAQAPAQRPAPAPAPAGAPPSGTQQQAAPSPEEEAVGFDIDTNPAPATQEPAPTTQEPAPTTGGSGTTTDQTAGGDATTAP